MSTHIKVIVGFMLLGASCLGISLGAAANTVAASESDTPSDCRYASNWYYYEPCVVRLSGHLVTKIEYGPPDYGEHPKTDRRGTIYVLLLDKPINVKGNPANELDGDSFTDVKAIQLAFDPSKMKIDGYVGKKVTAEGELFEAETGHHYTQVLMWLHNLSSWRRRW